MGNNTIPDMLKRLNDIYDREEFIQNQIVKGMKELKQLKEDKELLQIIIMHQSNKKARG